MKVTYEIENGKKIKVKTYDNGSVYKYDANGNEIYFKNFAGYEEWYEYDANGRVIHYKDSKGYEDWYKYDANGNMILTHGTIVVLNTGIN